MYLVEEPYTYHLIPTWENVAKQRSRKTRVESMLTLQQFPKPSFGFPSKHGNSYFILRFFGTGASNSSLFRSNLVEKQNRISHFMLSAFGSTPFLRVSENSLKCSKVTSISSLTVSLPQWNGWFPCSSRYFTLFYSGFVRFRKIQIY